ncbi:MAG: hypothetical protein LKCHEGNO_02707 [Burkholderiaceae bacterium]|nr:hypothetical protein [Burkholderiaceae bacterium]
MPSTTPIRMPPISVSQKLRKKPINAAASAGTTSSDSDMKSGERCGATIISASVVKVPVTAHTSSDSARTRTPTSSAATGRSESARSCSPMRVRSRKRSASSVNSTASPIASSAALDSSTPARRNALPGTRSGNGCGCWPPVRRSPTATMPMNSATVIAALLDAPASANQVVATKPIASPVAVPAASPASTARPSGTPAWCSTTITKVPVVPIAAPVKLTTATSR